MGNYVNLYAKDGCFEQINDLWAQSFPGESFLIMTDALARKEIERIQSDPDWKHLRYITTPEQWDEALPIAARGRGQIFISACAQDLSQQEAGQLRLQVQFVLDNRFLFAEVTGLEDAREVLEMDVPDGLDGHGQPVYGETLTFDQLPREPRSALYRLCVEYGRPDLWRGFVAFREAQTWEAWETLRNAIVPWDSGGVLGRTVWQLAERSAEARDGEDHGLAGRFRDGNVPSLFEVEQALRRPENIARQSRSVGRGPTR